MAEVISTCSANDTSGNTSGGGFWYTNLTSWESARQGNTNHEIVECYNDFGGPLDSTTLTVSGWGTTDATNHPTIRPAVGQGHNGIRGDGFNYRTAGASVLANSQAFLLVQGITFTFTAPSPSYCIRLNAGSENTIIERMFLITEGTATNSGVGIDCRLSDIVARNNIIIANENGGTGSYGIFNNLAGINTNLDNNVVLGYSSAGIWSTADTGSITNNICFDTVNPDFDLRGALTATTCASEDGTESTLVITTADFVNYPTDLRPLPGGLLDGAGTDLSGSFTNDITGYQRIPPWDIGAYAIQGAAPSVTFDGPNVIAQTGTENVLFSFNENTEGTVASRFTGATSYALAPTSDALPNGLTVNGTTGNIEGTPTVTFTGNIIIEGSD